MAIQHKLSDGTSWTQSQIRTKLSKAYKGLVLKYRCEGCMNAVAQDHDHTISQSRCKQIHKTELIIDRENIEFSCRECHDQWEGYKSGKFANHANAVKRMLYTKIHDAEGYMKRLLCISEGHEILTKLEENEGSN